MPSDDACLSPSARGGEEPGDLSAAKGALDLVLELDRLKLVERRSPVIGSGRAETTAEHSWSLVISVLIFARFGTESINTHRALALAAIHDAPEAFVGDTFVFGEEEATRPRREATAMEAFTARHRETNPIVVDLLSMWKEVENGSTAEGRFVHALDVLLPVFMNARNPENSSWRRYAIHASQVRARIERVQQVLPILARLAEEAVSSGVAAGALLEK